LFLCHEVKIRDLPITFGASLYFDVFLSKIFTP